MIGVVVISHGKLSYEMVNSAKMILGDTEQIEWEGIMPGDTPDQFLSRIREAVKRVNTGDGVIALVDLYGGTPGNAVARLAQEIDMKIVTGVNLPMLIYAVSERESVGSAEEMARGLLEAGIKGIREFSLGI
ncbi:MAG TPA: PTS sugar transporter subunit IIA [Anaerovoracaceae bacterium]|nr:PTS sugar transporter subunit IIA [Anaerovoracaceae bacterium]